MELNKNLQSFHFSAKIPHGTSTNSRFIIGSSSSEKEKTKDNTFDTTPPEWPEQQYTKDPSNSQALGYAIGLYLNQASHEEPWNFVVKREERGKGSKRDKIDGLARKAEGTM